MCLLFQIKSTAWGRGGRKSAQLGGGNCSQIATLTPVTTGVVKSHLELYTHGVTNYHQYVHKTGHFTSREMPVLKYTRQNHAAQLEISSKAH